MYQHTLPSANAFVRPTYPLTRLFTHPSISLHDYRPNRLSALTSIPLQPIRYTLYFPTCLSTYRLSAQLCIRPPLYPPSHLSPYSSIRPSVYPPARPSAHPFKCPCAHPSISLLIYPLACLFAQPTFRPPVYQPNHISAHPCISLTIYPPTRVSA